MSHNNGMTLAEIGAALAKLPDEVVLARFAEIGFVVDGGGPDLDRMEAAGNQEDWWRIEP